ncbi:putative periplasmic serine endoprotease DegP-like precursor [Planctomycetes bacterium Pan216]|uniref:Putative periplasmic serine endoprotease DegP-like n=1 Tax=Kolteria novifilia TaxID=2527975 RepID=A0A518BCS9_9BACT|nr:putative periplasmic serine endoprotease DegP-like precursor [Planctomycetes bacterium Pan216]
MKSIAARSFPLLLVVLFSAPLVGNAEDLRRTPVVRAIDKTKAAIVNIRTLRTIPARFDSADAGGRVRGLGTGVLIDPRGFLVTNFHVVEEVDTITVTTSDKQEYKAHVVADDSRADLALLKVDSGRSFPYLPLWGVDQPIVGETVIAIGNPYGLDTSVTTGIVSAVDRELRLPNGELFEELLQTDASINPGNSGGPLININGDLLGINVAIRSNAQGIGFAIPTDEVRRIVQNLMNSTSSSVTNHGLVIEERRNNGSDRESNSIVQVRHVEPDSPAAKLGFREGDQLLTVDGQRVSLSFDVNRIFWNRKYGEKLVFSIRRGDTNPKQIWLTITPPKGLSDDEVLWRIFGISTRSVPASRVEGVHDDLNGGLLLLDVASGSAASRSGFQPGDILIGLHDWEMIEPENVRYVMQWDELTSHQPVKYHVIRDGKIVSGSMRVPAFAPDDEG